jgi:hypothetical protein
VCILVNSPLGNDSWRMRRSVEVLGFHQGDREMRILVGLYVENRLPAGADNYLGIMHRGNMECFVQPAWPLPLHPDESIGDGGVLHQIYGDLFEEIEGEVFQIKTLTAWDDSFEIKRERPIPWHPKRISEDRLVESWGWPWEPETLPASVEECVPFTTWKFGPFADPTSYLITFALRIRGKTYDKLVDRDREFTVEGPEHLLSRIKYDDLLRLSDQEQSKWRQRLEPFESSRLLFGSEGYDVIILNPPLADRVLALGGSIGIVPAPKQPTSRGVPTGERFITSNQAFSMTLRYAVSLAPYSESEVAVHK